jgi:DNA-binding MarR family transcriptional regulator
MQLSEKTSLPPTPGRWISAIHRMKTVFLDRELTPVGLNGSIYLYIVVLDAHGSQMQEVFCRELSINKGCVARSLSRLEELGYVSRKPDPNDGRAMCVDLTAKGRKIVPQVRKALKAFTEILTDGMTPAQADQSEKLLMTMRENLANHFSKCKAGAS